MNSVVLFGDINIDILMSIPRYPPAGGDAMAGHVAIRPGGSVANTAIVLSKLGLKTRLVGRVGNDIWAEKAMQPLIDSGVDLTHVSRDPVDSTGLIFIPVTSDGERTMFSYRGANIHKPADEIEPGILDSAGFLHISSYNLLESPQREATYKLVDLARNRNLKISVDVGVEPALRLQDELIQLMPSLSLVVLSVEEARNLVDADTPHEISTQLLDQGVSLVGLKLGRSGCLVAGPRSQHLIPGFAVDTVDTTGAGDSFCAGLIYGCVSGLGLGACGVIANALGALATTVWGCGLALPGSTELDLFLDQQGEDAEDPELGGWIIEARTGLSG